MSLFAGCIYPLSLAPFDYWAVGMLSVVVLLISIGFASVWRGAFRFYLFGIGMYAVGASWVYVSIHEHGNASPVLAGSLVALACIGVSLPMLFQGYLYQRFFRAGVMGPLMGFTALWLAKEWIFTWFLTGFPWLFAGYGHLETPLAGYAPYLGVLGVGFMTVLSACLVFISISTDKRQHQALAIGSLLFIWITGFGLSKIELVSEEGGEVSVSLVQGNIDQKVKWQREMRWSIIRTYVELTATEWGRQVIVWPEAAIPALRQNVAELLDELDAKGKEAGSTLVLGLPDQDEEGNILNAAIAIGDGQGEYFKRRLVPFGEYVPLEGILRGLIDLFDLPSSHNEEGPWIQPSLRASDLKLAMSVCYEIVYPDLVRNNPEAPDLLVTISNDTWFGDSIGPLQHMQMARMRALENGRYLIRATNDGVSALVDHRGRVVGRLPQFEAGVLRGEVRKMSGITPFVRFGHIPILVLGVLLIVGQLVSQRRGTR